MKLLRLVIVLSIAVIVALYCSHPSQPNTGLSNQYSIYLTGRVLDKNGNPVANAVAKLADKNLSYTTGSDGYYYITEKKTAGLPKTASVGDSLQILKAGQVITYLDIPKWIDTLPDVFLVQCDIAGNLSSPPASISRITATLTGDSIPDSLARIALLGYLPATVSYSGFIFFVYTAQTLNYNVYISVYDADSALIGRSMNVPFTSLNSLITIPTFNPNNVAPIVYAGNDTTVSINDTIRLHATASDSFGKHIAKWEWNINNTGFRQTATGDTIIVAPADSDSLYVCVVRVTNNDGIATVDTMIVDVVLDPPIVYAGNDTVVAENSQVTLQGSATQEFGIIVKWEWNINNTGFVRTSTGDTTITTPDSFVLTYPCILRATDDDGQIGEDTVNLQVGIPWDTLGSGMAGGVVCALAVDRSGNLYAGGGFTSAGGVATNYISKWNGSSWSALGSGMNWQGEVDAFVFDNSGNLYVGGQFDTAGGVAANYIAKWDGNSWSALGTGMNSYVHALAFDSLGNLYAGGEFTTAGGVTANYIAKWDGNSWSALGTGITGMDTGYVHALAVDRSGNLYAGGQFDTMGGVPANNIAKWNGSSWSALGSGFGGGGIYGKIDKALAIDGSGNLYAGGNFTTAGGATVNYIAKWNGSAWSALGTGMSDEVMSLAIDRSGNIIAGGRFTTAGSDSTAIRIAKWNGSAWSALLGSGSGLEDGVRALAIDGSGNIYLGGEFNAANGITANFIVEYK
jgi:hypothetical protein